MNAFSKKQYREMSDETLDALYSAHCLKVGVYYLYVDDIWVDSNGDPIPKYCDAYSREYIVRKVKRATSNDNR